MQINNMSFMNRILSLLAGAVSFLFSVMPSGAQNPSSYVNPMIGTDGMGHTFPGDRCWDEFCIFAMTN